MDKEEFVLRILSQKGKMYRLAKCLLREEAQAEDTVQDVFVKLWIKREKLSTYENLEGYVMTAVRNTCKDVFRNKKRIEEKSLDYFISYIQAEDYIAAEANDIKNIMEQIIASLPRRQALVIHLKDVEGYTTEEIIPLAEMDAAAIRMTLSRARKTVREKLSQIMNYGIKK